MGKPATRPAARTTAAAPKRKAPVTGKTSIKAGASGQAAAGQTRSKAPTAAAGGKKKTPARKPAARSTASTAMGLKGNDGD